MAERCTSCLRENKDESLSIAISEAQKMAAAQNKPIAVVEDGGEYYFYDAFVAYEQHLNVKTVVR